MRSLTAKQQKFVEGWAAGKSCAAAARDAGYSPALARRAADRLAKIPAVQTEFERITAAVRENAVYSRERLITDLQDTIAFAKANKNSMAVVKAVELIAKLSGHLSVAEVEIRIDIGAALAEARSRAARPPIDVEYSEIPKLSQTAETAPSNPFDD